MYLIRNKRTKDFIDKRGDWTLIRSFAKRFPSKLEAQRFIDKNQIAGDDPYMEIISESVQLAEPKVNERIKSFKQFLNNSKVIKESFGTNSKKKIEYKFDKIIDEIEGLLDNARSDFYGEAYATAVSEFKEMIATLNSLVRDLTEVINLDKAGKLTESFPAAPSISGAIDDSDNYNKYVKASNDWKAKCQDKCNELSNKIQRMAGRFSYDILNSSKTSLSNKEKEDALNEFEKIYNDLDRLMDKTKIKKN